MHPLRGYSSPFTRPNHIHLMFKRSESLILFLFTCATRSAALGNVSLYARCLWFWNLIWEASLIGSHEVFTLLCFIVFSVWCDLLCTFIMRMALYDAVSPLVSFMSNTFLTIMTGWARVSRFNGATRCSRFPRTRRADWTSWREGQWSGHQSTVIFMYLYI